MSNNETTIINYSAAPDYESIQKQIVTSGPDQILLVISTRPSSPIDGLHLRLFKRLALKYHKKFALVTRNIASTELANTAGIPVFRSVGEAKRRPWQAQTITQSILQPKQQNHPLPTGLKEKKHLRFPTLRDRTPFELGLGLFTISLYLFLPFYLFSSAQVEIHLAPTLRSMTFALNGRTTVLSADIAGNFPVHEEYQILEIDGQAQSSGFLSLPEDFSYGEIQVTNLSDEDIEIPAGLVVMTLDTPPVQFATTAPIQMDADSETQSISIKAVEPGKASNVAAETIQAAVGEFGSVVRVTNLKATIGGANRRVSTPTESDVNKLRETLLKTLQETVQNDFTTQLTESQTIVADSMIIDEIIKEEVVPTPGETAEVFNLSLRVRFRALLVDTSDLIWPAQQLLTASLPKNQVLVEDSLEIIPVTAPVLDGDTVSWEVFLHQKSLPVLTQQTLKPFAGGTKTALIQWLEDTYSVTQPVTIKTKPINAFWLPPFYERMEPIIIP